MTTDNLQQLNDTVDQFPAMWERCRSDPANLNNMYTIIGSMLDSITQIRNQLNNSPFYQPQNNQTYDTLDR